MARHKQVAPLRREPSDFENINGRASDNDQKSVGEAIVNGAATLVKDAAREPPKSTSQTQAGLVQLVICVGGIYASFLSWALLQERITTTSYGSSTSPEKFTYSVFLNTIQSIFASFSGYAYLFFSTPKGQSIPSPFPSRAILVPLILVAVTSSLASPFGYASLAHIDYITFILAKSCKLLPVMFLHLTIFRKSYPMYKYMVVFLVTAGVAVFTVYHPSSASKVSKGPAESSTWGLLLLGVNLLFDGLTNTTQDHIFTTYNPYSGPQMMVAQNVLSSLLTIGFLLFGPFLPFTMTAGTQPDELNAALGFISRNPAVFPAILSFAACGAVGQIFIYYTLSHFSSLVLVTVTVTRKMLTMMLSVVWFGHRLTEMQWFGVALVFGGIGAEAVIQRREKAAKDKAKMEKAKTEKSR